MGDDRECVFEDLENTYCPPLDPALFTAIACDFDLSNDDQVAQLRETLDTLKISALEQEDLPFDPSGTSGFTSGSVFDGDGIRSERSTSRNETSKSRETDLTSLESDISSLNIERGGSGIRSDGSRRSSAAPVGYIVGPNGSACLTGMSLDDKVCYLSEMFPSVETFTIKHTLTKCDEDVHRSMDVLLNLAFFEEQGPCDDEGKVSIPKGIDGFLGEVNDNKGKRKGKKKKGKERNLFNPSTSQDEVKVVNKWEISKTDIEFISSRTAPILAKEVVASAYHANGASLPATIRSLATTHAPKDEERILEQPVMATQVAELNQEFPTIPKTTLAGLLKITRNSISAANELASAMLDWPSRPQLSDLIRITAAPPVLDEDIEEPKSKADRRIARDYESARSAAGTHLVAGAEAFTKASAAYRRGRSDKLMGGAAAYYSSIGREHIERAKREASAAADALVETQSTTDSIDLHGVTVQDAVRIANNRVSQWWESLGDAKYTNSGGSSVRRGYRIVTGAGRHSRDGTSRLGPAVGKMLAREGWRVEVGEGVLTVTGKVRRR
ncbi:hypothetical protein Plec18167_002964 [Paecilomyces lecythidis]|uniref:Smr domain-containing protein n=1 Tax=Paecilomyces lecythidis TaxID=3004212 RepID=A0ABR3Y2N2_9EURO